MDDSRAMRAALPVLVGAGLILSLAMGIRQCFGLFVQPLTRDLGLSVAAFTLAVSVRNLAWGLLQPFAGALAVRLGFRPILLAGALAYVSGLVVLAGARGVVGVMLSAGLMIGLALACTASAMAPATAARAVSGAMRSTVLGVISGVGSLGALAAAPLGEAVTAAFGWRAGVLALAALALGLVPAAWFAARADRIALPRTDLLECAQVGAAAVIGAALHRAPFLVMTGAYFVCGMQLLFVAVHLPSYLAICGMNPMLSAQALGVIGIFDVFGSVFFGWAGGRWSKLVLLGGIYVTRSVVLAGYFVALPTPESTLVFAALMGFLWLGVGPLVAGSVVEMFGLRWQAMVQGLAFMSHQLGSFAGAFGGGVLFDALGSYDLAWRLAVALGLAAGTVQIVFALVRPIRMSLAIDEAGALR
jgi:predicted MFS family arabinose efflux permease